LPTAYTAQGSEAAILEHTCNSYVRSLYQRTQPACRAGACCAKGHRPSVELAYVDQAYTGDQPAADAAAQGIRLEVVMLP
jgi:hypothetical protein